MIDVISEIERPKTLIDLYERLQLLVGRTLRVGSFQREANEGYWDSSDGDYVYSSYLKHRELTGVFLGLLSQGSIYLQDDSMELERGTRMACSHSLIFQGHSAHFSLSSADTISVDYLNDRFQWINLFESSEWKSLSEKVIFQ